MNGQSKILEPGEGLLLAGLLMVLASAYLGPQVMLGLLAFITGPLALALLFSGVVRARERTASIGWRVAGFLLLTLAIGGLFAGSIVAADVSAREARLVQTRQEKVQSRVGSATQVHFEIQGQFEAQSQPLATRQPQAPPNLHWTVQLVSRLAPAFMGLGLLCWTGWAFWRCLAWSGVILLIFPAIRLLIRTLGPHMVLTA